MESSCYKGKSKWKNLKREVLKKNLSLSEQSFSIQKQFPQFTAKLDKDKVTWIGTLQPLPMSCNYTVKIEYELKGSPKVWVLNPKLKSYEGNPIPHMYSQEKLCLFYPKTKEWKRSMWISQTIIPWISLWLNYYEYWLITGQWLGGGISHNSPDEGEEKDVQNFID